MKVAGKTGKKKIFVNSEVGRLRKVIVHQPDKGIEIVTPTKALEFLYDDIVYLPRMLEEHKTFTKILSLFIGKSNVHDTQQLLRDVLENSEEIREELMQSVCKLEGCGKDSYKILKELSLDDLVFTLFTGMIEKDRSLLFAPLPNYVFTRDIGVVINDHIIICQASKKARTRETVITSFIIYYHPLFKDNIDNDRIIDLTESGEEITIEGGDIMAYDKDYVLIGHSERTTKEAIYLLRDKLFEKNVVKNVVMIDIPKERTCMHIDTLFTQISKTDFVIYEPYVMHEEKIKITHFVKDEEQPKSYPNLFEFLKTVNPRTRFISCGGGVYPYDEREQWTDGCNLVAIKNGVAIAYERNYKTAEALKSFGYSVVDAKTFIHGSEQALFNLKKIKKTIITIPATELSRARGGPHCMSFPLIRKG